MAQHLDLIYTYSGILYEIIPEAPRSTTNFAKPNPGTHDDGMVGSVNTLIVESLAKQIHEIPTKNYIAKATKDANPSP